MQPVGRAVLTGPPYRFHRSLHGRIPARGSSFEPMQQVQCWLGARSAGDERLFVTADEATCGWVDPTRLLNVQTDSNATIECRLPEPMRRIDSGPGQAAANGAPIRAIALNGHPNAPGALSDMEIPVFDRPGGRVMGRVPLFAIYPVFAIRIHGGEAHYLIGASQHRLKGWLRGRYGAILDQALAVRPRPAHRLTISGSSRGGGSRPTLAQILYRPADEPTKSQALPVYPVLSDDGDSLELAVAATACSARDPCPMAVGPPWDGRQDTEQAAEMSARIDRLAPIAARLVTNPRTASESSDRSPLSGFRGRVASHGRSTGGTYWERLALLEESELPILAGVMETLCHASRDRAAAIGTEQRVSQLLGAVSGDRIEGTKTPYGYLEQVLGIPFPERTLLRRPLTEIEEYLVRLTDSAERESLRKGLCRASTLLGLIRRGQRPDPDKGMRWTGTGWDVEKPQPFDWTLQLKDEPGLIPIPLDYFP